MPHHTSVNATKIMVSLAIQNNILISILNDKTCLVLNIHNKRLIESKLLAKPSTLT